MKTEVFITPVFVKISFRSADVRNICAVGSPRCIPSLASGKKYVVQLHKNIMQQGNNPREYFPDFSRKIPGPTIA